MFESCHHSGDSDGSTSPRCADVAEKLAQLFGWRQTYRVEKLQRSLADSVARRNLLQQQQARGQLAEERVGVDKVSGFRIVWLCGSPNGFRGASGTVIIIQTNSVALSPRTDYTD
jgi:hypothetical protein